MLGTPALPGTPPGEAPTGADVIAAVFVIDLPALGEADRTRGLGVPVRTR